MRKRTIHREQPRNHLYTPSFIHKVHSFSLVKLWITFCPKINPPCLFPSGFSPPNAPNFRKIPVDKSVQKQLDIDSLLTSTH